MPFSTTYGLYDYLYYGRLQGYRIDVLISENPVYLFSLVYEGLKLTPEAYRLLKEKLI